MHFPEFFIKWVREGVPVGRSLLKLPACLARTNREQKESFLFFILDCFLEFQRRLTTSRRLRILVSFLVHARNREQKRVLRFQHQRLSITHTKPTKSGVWVSYFPWSFHLQIRSGRRWDVTFERMRVCTVAILAQGTNRGDALCAALSFLRVGSNPALGVFLCADLNA